MVRKSTRRRRMGLADNRCEFIYDPIVYPKFSRKIRCPKIYDLHAHHLTYVRFNKENINDIIMLCPMHHATTHLRMLNCNRCRHKIFRTDFEAERYWRNFVKFSDFSSSYTGEKDWGEILTRAKDRLYLTCSNCSKKERMNYVGCEII